jgi:hypothetical protein
MSEAAPMDPIYALARRLRPDLDAFSPAERLSRVTDILGVLVAAPLFLIGVIWLASTTDLTMIARQWLILLVIGVAMYIFNQLSFFAITNLGQGGGTYGNVQTTPVNMVKWSAIFIFGPTALWLDILVNLFSPSWRSAVGWR